jgi:hypothetical protein
MMAEVATRVLDRDSPAGAPSPTEAVAFSLLVTITHLVSKLKVQALSLHLPSTLRALQPHCLRKAPKGMLKCWY